MLLAVAMTGRVSTATAWRLPVRLGTLALLIVLASSAPPSEAQPAGKAPRVGYVGLVKDPAESRRLEAFTGGLRDLGYTPGQTIVVEVKEYTTPDQLRQAVRDLVQAKIDIIMVGPPVAAAAARQATRDIPIVCGTCGHPVVNGLATSLARPGGNVTGLASLSAELIGKRVEQMKELLPAVSRLAVLLYPTNPGTPATISALETTSRTLRIDLPRVKVRGLGDFESAFRAAAASGARGLVIQDDPLTRAAATRIAQLQLTHRLPVSAGIVEVAEAGALIGYGPDRGDMYRRAAGFVDRILKGTNPADIPFEQPTKFTMILNTKTARALALTVPQAILVRADRVIE